MGGSAAERSAGRTDGAAGDWYGAFAGRWRLTRTIADRTGGPDGRFEGRATFTPEGARTLRYVEEGRLHLGDGAVLVASRTYLWTVWQNRVEVAFEDGSPFHAFSAGQSGAGSDHLCVADHYRVTYDFGRWPVWSTLWRVTGPRKDYEMTSRFSPDPIDG